MKKFGIKSEGQALTQNNFYTQSLVVLAKKIVKPDVKVFSLPQKLDQLTHSNPSTPTSGMPRRNVFRLKVHQSNNNAYQTSNLRVVESLWPSRQSNKTSKSLESQYQTNYAQRPQPKAGQPNFFQITGFQKRVTKERNIDFSNISQIQKINISKDSFSELDGILELNASTRNSAPSAPPPRNAC